MTALEYVLLVVLCLALLAGAVELGIQRRESDIVRPRKREKDLPAICFACLCIALALAIVESLVRNVN